MTATATGRRVPPHDIDAERAVLGAVLINASGVLPRLDGLSAGDFYDARHAELWTVIAELAGTGETIDPVTVGARARQRDVLNAKVANDLICDAMITTPSLSAAPAHAAIIQRASLARRALRLASDIEERAYAGGDWWTPVAALAAAAAEPQPATVDVCVPWEEFWSKDRREAEWLYPPILARGRGHAIFAAHKVGKSLLALDICTRLATGRAPVVAVYLDYEQTEDDLYERLSDMGYGPDSDLSRLRYALLPSLPPLDQPEGAKALAAILDTEQAARLDHHLVVVIDTTGRAVAGEENSADTVQNWYRHTGLGLKQRGVTWARLDHAGKDGTKGQRGSSAKGDDVDIVWRVTPADDGLLLKREAARMSWVPERVALRRRDDPLTFTVAEGMWPAGTADVAQVLDQLDVPVDVGERPAGQALRDAGHRHANAIIRAAQRWRRQQANEGLR